jgi:hypothetical protein
MVKSTIFVCAVLVAIFVNAVNAVITITPAACTPPPGTTKPQCTTLIKQWFVLKQQQNQTVSIAQLSELTRKYKLAIMAI